VLGFLGADGALNALGFRTSKRVNQIEFFLLASADPLLVALDVRVTYGLFSIDHILLLLFNLTIV